MVPRLPDYLQPFRSKAQECIKRGLVREIQFSGPTYQIQVVDPQTQNEEWVFLQLDAHGNIQDRFCSCGEEEEEPAHCVHLAAAFLRIYNGEHLPLHQRFEKSLWNQLCRLYAERVGEDPDDLKTVGAGRYAWGKGKTKKEFFVTGKTSAAKRRLKELIEERLQETEETSLKFSNLSQEELQRWRMGRPSAQLRYELSYWNDLAHWLMWLQDCKTPYKISFEYGKQKLPNQITISFPDIEIGFSLTPEDLPKLIPSLATVQTPLAVHFVFRESIERITYDKATGTFSIQAKKARAAKTMPVGAIALDGWWYVPEDGFYAKEQDPLLSKTSVSGNLAVDLLNTHYSILQRYLDGETLHLDPVQISYSLAFDKSWNLHITGYVFTVGDLLKPGSRVFGDWVYIDEHGFYPIGEAHFKAVETVVEARDISEFVQDERSWLNTQEGFVTHLGGLSAQISYALSADSRLSFSRLEMADKLDRKLKDFDGWVYVTGHGFYPKVTTQTRLPLGSDMAIPADQIPLFIRMNHEDLQLIPGFFSEHCPLERVGLSVNLEKNDLISVSPQYEVLPEYRFKDVRFFDEYTYVAGEGFYELPAKFRLPEHFRHPLEIDQKNMPQFFTQEWPIIQPYILETDPVLRVPISLCLYVHSITAAAKKGAGWYALEVSFQTEQGLVPLAAVWTAIKRKKRFLFSSAGRFDLSDKRFNWIRSVSKHHIEKRSNTLHVNTLELIRLYILEEFILASGDTKSAGLLRELTEFQIPEVPDLTGLKSELRPYQLMGVHWLWFLYQYHLSGLLCDEMGLGKTHQTMALFAAIKNYHQKEQQAEGKRRQFLVVCPTSVIYHWQEKLEEFLPDMRVCVHHGTLRSLKNFKECDILLTSYGIWRIDNAQLRAIPFEVAVFDEVQIAKNARSRVHASLKHVDSEMRLGLTGTPIENRLRELKSLFDLVLPTYMPGDTDYRELFIKPIEREGSKERRSLLKRFIHPFVLRRIKSDVLVDLPEKVEEIAHCDLSADQHAMYQEVLHLSRQRLVQQIQDEGRSIPYMHIFALLSSLKQICDHPAVFLKQPEHYKKYTSGKWELFVELLNEARESQQKVVVFSQYLAMLDILEAYLDDMGIGFATIRGATINRGEQVYRFNNDPACEVFLGSLQAAGLGVDLTAGSVVIHYDRWWNAARENQATDRVHRIGQTRGVQVFKLVTKNTFEERIDELISRKGKLMEEVVSTDDHRFLKQFTRDELIMLLQDVEDIRTE